MVDYKERLHMAMMRSGKSTQELADRLNISYQAVRKVLIGTTKSFSAKNNDVAAQFLGVPSRWLATGVGRQDLLAENVRNVRNTVTVPLITWNQLSALGGNLLNLDVTPTVGEWVATYGEELRPAAFALAVIGDPMVSSAPGEDSFPDGTIIIVDPGEPASTGDFVVAMDPNSGMPTFKRLVNDAGRWFLRPLNPAYPTTEITNPKREVLGRVIEYQLRRKL